MRAPARTPVVAVYQRAWTGTEKGSSMGLAGSRPHPPNTPDTFTPSTDLRADPRLHLTSNVRLPNSSVIFSSFGFGFHTFLFFFFLLFAPSRLQPNAPLQRVLFPRDSEPGYGQGNKGKQGQGARTRVVIMRWPFRQSAPIGVLASFPSPGGLGTAAGTAKAVVGGGEEGKREKRDSIAGKNWEEDA